MKKIVIVPQLVLNQPTSPVVRFDRQLKRILSEMKEALLSAKNPKGVGLAAPQIGYSLSIFAVKPTDKDKITFYVNPKIISCSTEVEKLQKNTPLEGCLSIPNTWGVVKRKKWVRLAFQDTKGNRKQKTFFGFEAVIVQHEMDHLKGILFTQRVLEQCGKLYEIIKDENGEERLRELPI